MGVLDSIVGTTVDVVARGGPRRQYKWNKRAAQDANAMNRANQQWLLEQQQAIQREQREYERKLQAEAREYDSPQAQMARYLAAGLNPHLIYGTGSSAGQAFPINDNMISAPGLPAVNISPAMAGYGSPGTTFMSMQQAEAQRALTEARTEESISREALLEVQRDIARTNPMLQKWVAEWINTSMAETARLKALEARAWMSNQSPGYSKITAKVNAQLEALEQQLGLNTTDLEIKNRILESKEFENAVKEIQAKWLKDGEVTPEHIRQAWMLLMTKLLGPIK